eukprot:scaffold869_cov105-Isochrysis_galbana.AAC.6
MLERRLHSGQRNSPLFGLRDEGGGAGKRKRSVVQKRKEVMRDRRDQVASCRCRHAEAKPRRARPRISELFSPRNASEQAINKRATTRGTNLNLGHTRHPKRWWEGGFGRVKRKGGCSPVQVDGRSPFEVDAPLRALAQRLRMCLKAVKVDGVAAERRI